MDIATKPLEEVIRDLSPNLRNEVQIFVDALLKQANQTVKPKLRQDWAGMLKASSYTSVELQHLASEWRNI
jgi:hypothetical protein